MHIILKLKRYDCRMFVHSYSCLSITTRTQENEQHNVRTKNVKTDSTKETDIQTYTIRLAIPKVSVNPVC